MSDKGNETAAEAQPNGSDDADQAAPSKGRKSVIFPGIPLRRSVDLARQLESKWGTARLPRTDAATELDYKGLTGTATKTLTAMAAFGLLETAGRGYVQVSPLAKRLLHPADAMERSDALRDSCFRPPLFAMIRERFQGVEIPPSDGVINFLRQENYDPKYISTAARQYVEAVRYVQEAVGKEGAPAASDEGNTENSADEPKLPGQFKLVLQGLGGTALSVSLKVDEDGALDLAMQQTLMKYLSANLRMLEGSGSDENGD